MPYIDFAGNTRELPPGDTLVGSGPQASWRLQNDGLAPRHFVLAVGPDGATALRPHAATTVVIVNGRRAPMAPTPLAHGDVIAAGGASLRYLQHLPGPDERPRAAAPAPPAAPAHLLHEAAGVAYPLDRPVVRIGRGTGSDVVVREASVSRAHAEVRSEAGEFVLHSAGSSGTRVNGLRTATAVLEEGDVLEVGGTELRFTRRGVPAGLEVRRAAAGPGDDLSRRETRALRLEALTRARGGPGPWVIVLALLAFAAFTAAVALWLLR